MADYKGVTHTIVELLARRKIQAVPRKRDDERTELKNVARQEDDRRGEIPTRQQEIQKKIIDEETLKKGDRVLHVGGWPGMIAGPQSKWKPPKGTITGTGKHKGELVHGIKVDGKEHEYWGYPSDFKKINETQLATTADPAKVKKPKKLEIEDIGKQPPTPVVINPELDNTPNVFASTEVKGKLVEDKYNNVSIQYQNNNGIWVTARKTSSEPSDIMMAMKTVQKAYSNRRIRAVGARGLALDFWPIDPQSLNVEEETSEKDLKKAKERTLEAWWDNKPKALKNFKQVSKALKKKEVKEGDEYTGTVLPIKRTAQGQLRPAVPTMFSGSPAYAKDVYQGKADPRDPENTGKNLSLAVSGIVGAKAAKEPWKPEAGHAPHFVGSHAAQSAAPSISPQSVRPGTSAPAPQSARASMSSAPSTGSATASSLPKPLSRSLSRPEVKKYNQGLLSGDNAEGELVEASAAAEIGKSLIKTAGISSIFAGVRKTFPSATAVVDKLQTAYGDATKYQPGYSAFAKAGEGDKLSPELTRRYIEQSKAKNKIKETVDNIVSEILTYRNSARQRPRDAYAQAELQAQAKAQAQAQAQQQAQAQAQQQQQPQEQPPEEQPKKQAPSKGIKKPFHEAKDPRHTGIEVDEPKFNQSIQRVAAHTKWNAGAVHSYKHADGSKTRVDQDLGTKLHRIIHTTPNRHRADVIQKIHSSKEGLNHVVKHGWHGKKDK